MIKIGFAAVPRVPLALRPTGHLAVACPHSFLYAIVRPRIS